MSPSRNLACVMRYRRFESGFLQRRVREPSVPEGIQHDRRQGADAVRGSELRDKGAGIGQRLRTPRGLEN
jgi:hypothetical protein